MKILLALSACALLSGCSTTYFDGKPNPRLLQTIHSPSVKLEYRVRLNEIVTVKEVDAIESAVASAQSKCEEMGAGSALLLSEERVSTGRVTDPAHRVWYYLRFACTEDE